MRVRSYHYPFLVQKIQGFSVKVSIKKMDETERICQQKAVIYPTFLPPASATIWDLKDKIKYPHIILDRSENPWKYSIDTIFMNPRAII